MMTEKDLREKWNSVDYGYGLNGREIVEIIISHLESLKKNERLLAVIKKVNLCAESIPGDICLDCRQSLKTVVEENK